MEKLSFDEFITFEKSKLAGKVICFPTDTVYGIGALYNDQEAISKIYKMKSRDLNKPLANLCNGLKQIESLGIGIPKVAKELIDKHWPGALTIIFDDKDNKISFRMPNSEIALKLLNKFSILTTTSVNESGEPELNSYDEINLKFGSMIDYYIDDEVSLSKLASTVVDVSGGSIKVLRQGSIIL